MSANLSVWVEDSKSLPVSNALVTLRLGKTTVSVKPVRPGSYEALSLVPGAWRLSVSHRTFLKETYDLTLRDGSNSTRIVLGKKGEPFYYAAGKKIYFEPTAGEFMIAAYGENARETVSEMVAASDAAAAASFETAGGPPDSCFVRIGVARASAPFAGRCRLRPDRRKSGGAMAISQGPMASGAARDELLTAPGQRG